MNDSSIRQFLDLKKSDSLNLHFGGKGAGLIRLHLTGLRIPETWGFSCEQWKLLQGAEWSAWLKKIAFLDQSFLLPQSFFTQIDSLDFAPFVNRDWILRSSASVEDAAEDSFAGVFKSVVVEKASIEKLRAAAKEIFESMLTSTAIERVLESGNELQNYSPALLIQEWIEPEWAGVAFSCNPEKPWQRRPYLEMVSGRGEQLVSGEKNAIVIQDLRELEKLVSLDFKNKFVLNFYRIIDTTTPAIDTEFAWKDNTLYWLQARPIATREAQLLRLISSAPYDFRWSRDLTAERYPEPMSTLGWSQIADLLPENLRSIYRYFGISAKGHELLLQSMHGWVFSNDQFFKIGRGLRFETSWLIKNIPFLFFRFFKNSLLSFISRVFQGHFSNVKSFLKVQLLMAWMEPAARRVQREWQPRIERYLAAEKKWGADLPSVQDPLAQQARLRADAVDFLEPDLAIYIFKETLFKALLAWWAETGGDAQNFIGLCSQFSGNRTLEMSREWEKVIQNPNLKSAWMSRYGHIRMSWDPQEPGFSESAHYESGVQFGGFTAQQNPPSLIELGSNESRTMSDPVFRKYFLLLQDFMRMDEEMHLETGRLIRRARALILKSGEILVSTKVLKEVSEVFELELSELKRFLRHPTQAAWPACVKRREIRKRATENAPSAVIPPLEDHRLVEVVPIAGSIQGIGMSAGVIEGKVLFLEKPSAALPILPGTILLTTSPNPAWCPCYSALSGLVTVTGSQLSHGFVTAREYRLPAISGIENLKDKIKNGSRIRMNGQSGLIQILESE